MAKARIDTADGVTINVEGTPEEISAVLKNVKTHSGRQTTQKIKAKRDGRVTKTDLIEELRNEGFFKKPKGLGDVRTRLADLGHSFPLTALSGPLQTEVRRRRLRRFKEKGKYVYAQ